MKKFRSKIDTWIIILLIVLFIVVFWLSFNSDSPLNPFLVGFVPSLLLFGFIVFFINYIIDGDKLKIKIGPFSIGEIDIKKIVKISKSNSFISSPASSWDRIGIYISKVGKSPYSNVSPKDKKAFIAALLEVNPDIEVDLDIK